MVEEPKLRSTIVRIDAGEQHRPEISRDHVAMREGSCLTCRRKLADCGAEDVERPRPIVRPEVSGEQLAVDERPDPHAADVANCPGATGDQDRAAGYRSGDLECLEGCRLDRNADAGNR